MLPLLQLRNCLRPLLFHVDVGWNTNQAVENIEKLVDGLGLDLYTEVAIGRNKTVATSIS